MKKTLDEVIAGFVIRADLDMQRYGFGRLYNELQELVIDTIIAMDVLGGQLPDVKAVRRGRDIIKWRGENEK